jgi:hypothetical protein
VASDETKEIAVIAVIADIAVIGGNSTTEKIGSSGHRIIGPSEEPRHPDAICQRAFFKQRAPLANV